MLVAAAVGAIAAFALGNNADDDPQTNATTPTPTATATPAVAAEPEAVNELPDQLIRIDPSSGQITASISYPYGIMSITSSPTALWVASRRRARVQRVDLRTGNPVKTIRVGNSRSEDIVYSRGALWLATPDDDTVYKVDTGNASIIPISVGKRPRQLAVTRDTVYVTNYNSSDLTAIDTKTSRVIGAPLPLSVNPFSLAAGGDDTLWVGSQPENRLTKVATGRAG
jgi:YVTN family beta-propeller protein